MSFAFTCPDGGDSWSLLPDGSPLRTISKMTVHEYSAVLEGAYEKPVISTKEDLRSALRNAPGDIRDRVLRNADPQEDQEDDDIEVCQHSDDERSGITCDTCSQSLVDRDCHCEDESLRSWTCNDCGLSVDEDSDPGDDTTDVDELDEGQRALVASLLLRAAE